MSSTENFIYKKSLCNPQVLPASWVLVIFQDENQEGSLQKSWGKRQSFIKLVHKGINTEKGQFEVASGEKSEQGFKCSDEGYF